MRIFVLFLLVLSFHLGHAQTATLKGKVYGEQNEPLEGANVIYRYDVSRGAQTDKSGAFELTVPSGKALFVIRFTGMRSDTISI